MKLRHLTRLTSGAVVMGTAVLTFTLDWPRWWWFLLPTAAAGLALADMRVPNDVEVLSFSRHQEEEGEDPPPEAPYSDTSVVVVPVHSAVEDCPFLFSATIWWRETEGGSTTRHGNPAALATTSILQRVQQMTQAEHPARCAFLERWLEGVLGNPIIDGTGIVTAYATDVRLVLRRGDQEHLDELDGLRKTMGTWESRLQHERSVRTYLGDEVLQSPGSAVVWWMARHEDEIERAVEMISPLTVLSAAANNREIPQEFLGLFKDSEDRSTDEPVSGFDHPEPIDIGIPPDQELRARSAPPSAYVSGLLDEMEFARGSAERAAFGHGIARLSDRSGRAEGAENIREGLRREGPVSAATDGDGWSTAGSVPGPRPGPEPEAGPSRPSSSAEEAPGLCDDTAHRFDSPPLRSGHWQVTSEGVVTETEFPGAFGSEE